MSDLVDKVAEAMWRASRCNPDDPGWKKFSAPENFQRLAQVAIDTLDIRPESQVMPCHCNGVHYRPHKQGESGCTGVPVVALRWVSDWTVGGGDD